MEGERGGTPCPHFSHIARTRIDACAQMMRGPAAGLCPCCSADRADRPPIGCNIAMTTNHSNQQPTCKLTVPSGYGIIRLIEDIDQPAPRVARLASQFTSLKLKASSSLFVVIFCYLGLSTRVLFQSNMQTPPALSVQRQHGAFSSAVKRE